MFVLLTSPLAYYLCWCSAASVGPWFWSRIVQYLWNAQCQWFNYVIRLLLLDATTLEPSNYWCKRVENICCSSRVQPFLSILLCFKASLPLRSAQLSITWRTVTGNGLHITGHTLCIKYTSLLWTLWCGPTVSVTKTVRFLEGNFILILSIGAWLQCL